MNIIKIRENWGLSTFKLKHLNKNALCKNFIGFWIGSEIKQLHINLA